MVRALRRGGAVAREVRQPIHEAGGSRAVPRATAPVPETMCRRGGAEGLAGKRGAAAMMFVPLIIRCITARKIRAVVSSVAAEGKIV